MTDKAIDEEPITQLARSSGGTTSSTYRGHGETPVANINYRIYRPFPSTNQVLMVYRTGNNFTVSGSGATRVRGLTFRLNSINDCFTDCTYSANPDPSTGDTIDATPNVPSMRNFWSTVYRYYTVVRSRFHFRIRPNKISLFRSGLFSNAIFNWAVFSKPVGLSCLKIGPTVKN